MRLEDLHNEPMRRSRNQCDFLTLTPSLKVSYSAESSNETKLEGLATGSGRVADTAQLEEVL